MQERLRASLAMAWQRILGHATGRWLVLAGAVGVLSGLVGFAFNLGVNLLSAVLLAHVVGYHPHLAGPQIPLGPAGDLRPWLILPVMVLALGGIASHTLLT